MGFSAIAGVHYDSRKLASPTLSLFAFVFLLAICVTRNQTALNMEAVKAFSSSAIGEHVIYMKPPTGWIIPNGKTLKLNATLNGLKQSSCIWYTRVDHFIRGRGFARMVAEPCVYCRWSEGKFLSIVKIYNDDCRLQCDRPADVKAKFPSTDSEEDTFLGIKIQQRKESVVDGRIVAGSLMTSGEKYVDKVLTRLKMQDCHPYETPAAEGLKLVPFDEAVNVSLPFPYEELCGCLGWIAATSHPEIKFAVNQLKKFVRRPSGAHVRAAKRVLRHLSGCKAATQIYHQGDQNGLVELVLFADADFAGEAPKSGAKASTSCIVLFAKGVGLLHYVS